MTPARLFAAAALVGLLIAGCASGGFGAPSPPDVSALLKASFAPRGIADLDRLDQSTLQKVCSVPGGREPALALREQIEKTALAGVRYPSDGVFLGDWRRGEAIAQSGRGLQFTDTAATVAGGNCYACHQISRQELAHGNLGPSLYQYGKNRGAGEPILRYTWARLFNSHAFNACSTMPRFGDAGILTEAQLRDLMALLLDPASPVNRD